MNNNKFYKWLDTCPVRWNESNHPTSGMTSITFDLEDEWINNNVQSNTKRKVQREKNRSKHSK